MAYESDGDDHEALDAHLLAAKIAAEGNKGPRPRRLVERDDSVNTLRILTGIFVCRISEPSADPEDLQLLSPEEREQRRSFEAKSEPFIGSGLVRRLIV